jgi:hypothetical protein
VHRSLVAIALACAACSFSPAALLAEGGADAARLVDGPLSSDGSLTDARLADGPVTDAPLADAPVADAPVDAAPAVPDAAGADATVDPCPGPTQTLALNALVDGALGGAASRYVPTCGTTETSGAEDFYRIDLGATAQNDLVFDLEEQAGLQATVDVTSSCFGSPEPARSSSSPTRTPGGATWPSTPPAPPPAATR